MYADRIDFTMFIGSIIGFLVFFTVHVFVFRHIKKRDAVRWFFILLVVVGSILSVIQTYFYALPVFLSIAGVMLFIIISCCYFMGMFGLMATSVRIRILCDIARSGTKGMTMKQLVARYNREDIITRRLDRLTATGDIAYKHGKYHAKNTITFFVFPAVLLRLMKLLYG